VPDQAPTSPKSATTRRHPARSRPAVLLLLALAGVLVAAPSAHASELIARGARDIKFIVNRHHIARVGFTDQHGHRWHVLLWGAVNARAPTTRRRQVHFRIDYSGGHGSFGDGYWKRMHDFCRPYTGPPLTHLYYACDDPDGSHWAVQRWRRRLLNGGFPTHGTRHLRELHISHWTGKLPRLRIDNGWTYRRYDQVFGTFTYRGTGVYGFHATRQGAPLDSYGRNIYMDTHDPYWGKGWFRYNSGLSHRPTGIVCLGVYALYGRKKPAKGDKYRLIVMGPGVTPIIEADIRSPGRYNRRIDLLKDREQIRWAGSSTHCDNPH
jgi:hypothetical protein